MPFLGSSDLEHARPIDAESRGPAPEDPAFIQITSGSTGEPKGVELTHTAVLTNVEQMIAGMEITADDVFLSWLPVSHDMGLVLKTMVPFRLAARLELLPTRLSGVAQWLGAIERTRATFVAAPDFAWRMCLRAVREPGRWDLSSLRVALNAAEMVRPTTLAAFARTFALPRVMVPGYGLAEATVGVSMQPPGTTPPVDERGFVAIGRPFAGVRLAVLDGARELADGEVGELAVASPAVTTGYRDDPEATAALFWCPGWIRTGDLAYRRPDGAVFLVGRAKNLIIQGGRFLAPAEVEAAVEELGFVRRAAAIGVDRGGSRASRRRSWSSCAGRRRPTRPRPRRWWSVVEAVAARLGMRPARVDLLRPKSLPLTDTGKVRHGELRRRLLSGELAADGATPTRRHEVGSAHWAGCRRRRDEARAGAAVIADVLRTLAVAATAARHLAAHRLWRVLGREPIPGPQRLRLALEGIGGTYLKFGQVLSLQPDVLPPAYCTALFDLLDRVPPFAFAEVARTFSEDFGVAPAEVFDSFDEQPIASASVAQVHAATRGGRRLAVKVRRPDVARRFLSDLRVMGAGARLVRRLRIRSLTWLARAVEEFATWTWRSSTSARRPGTWRQWPTTAATGHGNACRSSSPSSRAPAS